MGFKIFVPGNCSELIQRFEQSDCSSLCEKLSTWPARTLLFYEELVVGFIIHTFHTTDAIDPPETAYLEVKSSSEEYLLAKGDSRILDISTDNGDDLTLEMFSSVVQNPIKCDMEVDGLRTTTSIWKFEVPAGYPKHDMTGCITFHASLANPHLQVSDHENVDDFGRGDLKSPLPAQEENLFGGLNFYLSQKATNDFLFSPRMVVPDPQPQPTAETEAVVEMVRVEPQKVNSDDSTSLSITLSIPLIVKLRSTKPGGRNDFLLSTLSIEASNELFHFVADDKDICFIHIMSLELQFRSGTISELGHLSFPRRFHVDEVVNITYKLINNDYLDSQMKNATGAPPNTSRPLQVSMRFQIQKYDSLNEEYVNVSNEISTLWSPMLEFGFLAPPASTALKSHNNSNFQVQSQFNSLTSLVKHNGSVPRKALMVNNVIGVTKSKPSLISSIASPSHSLAPSLLAYPPSPHVRPVPSSSSSPLLSLTRGGQFQTKKNIKSAVTLPTISSSVTVNLTSNATSTFAGLLLTFKGDLSIELGKIVTWKIQAINQSGRTLSLSLIVKNPRKRNPIYLQNDSSSVALGNISTSNMIFTDESLDSTLHIYNKLQLYTQYNLLKLGRGGVVLLKNDVRLGPMDPNQVFETEIQLIGIARGIFNLDGLRVVDLNNGDGIDFGRLLEVFVM